MTDGRSAAVTVMERREKVYSPRYNNTAVKTDSNKTQSGWLPERHKAHLCWPLIVTKKTITQNRFTAKCKVRRAQMCTNQ